MPHYASQEQHTNRIRDSRMVYKKVRSPKRASTHTQGIAGDLESVQSEAGQARPIEQETEASVLDSSRYHRGWRWAWRAPGLPVQHVHAQQLIQLVAHWNKFQEYECCETVAAWQPEWHCTEYSTLRTSDFRMLRVIPTDYTGMVLSKMICPLPHLFVTHGLPEIRGQHSRCSLLPRQYLPLRY